MLDALKQLLSLESARLNPNKSTLNLESALELIVGANKLGSINALREVATAMEAEKQAVDAAKASNGTTKTDSQPGNIVNLETGEPVSN